MTIRIGISAPIQKTANSGYTLVELLVAASLLGMCITGVMSMIAVGREVEGKNGLRQQALQNGITILENPDYHFSNYPLPPESSTPPITLVNENGGAVSTVTEFIVTEELSESFKDVGGGSILLWFQKVSISINWSVAGQAESVVLQKRITRVK
jgi:prepilin-type N-terminal cleavage/methylation domain-containing protein